MALLSGEISRKFRLALSTHSRRFSLYAALAPLCEWGTLHMKRIEARKESAEAKSRQKAVA
jgi:hypothetical protein